MAEKQNCVFLVVKQSLTYPDQYPVFVLACQDEEEAYGAAGAWNKNDEWFIENGYDYEQDKYYVKTVWL